jgi:hypothetical protein
VYVLPARAIQVSRIPNGGQADPALANATLYKTDSTGKLTGYAVYDGGGLIVKRVDLHGPSHGGVPTPHVVEYNHNRNPTTGEWFANPKRTVRPADPTTEVP